MTKSTISNFLRPAGLIFLDAAHLLIAFSVSLNLLRIFHLNFSPKYGVENLSHFSPESNFPVLVGIIVTTSLFFYALRWLQLQRPKLWRLSLAAILLASYLIGVTGPYYAGLQQHLDTFHHGEQLAPAVGYDEGKTPYRDLFILHGAGEDILTPWLSFKLFGESVGSYYLMTGLLQLMSVALFFYLLHKVFKNDSVFLLVILWFIMSKFAAFYYVRDIPTWISLLLVSSLLLDRSREHIKMAALGLTASLSLFYSYDRGSFLTIIFTVVTLGMLLWRRDAVTFSFNPRSFTQRLKLVGAACGGYALGLLAGIIFFGISGFLSFLRVTYEATKYQGAIFNYPFPNLSTGTFFSWLPVLCFIAITVVLLRDANKNHPYSSLTPASAFEIILLLFSFVFFRAATGRPDIGHVAYGSVVLFITFFYIFSRRINLVALSTYRMGNEWFLKYSPLLLIAILLFSPSTVDYLRLAEMNQMPLGDTRTFLHAPKKPDAFWIDGRTRNITAKIEQLTGPKDNLFVFSSEPIFYYTTRLPNPTRYSISWFADAAPFEQDMLNDLKNHPPKVIVYRSGSGFNDAPDYIDMTVRLPAVNAWILKNYPNQVYVENAILRMR